MIRILLMMLLATAFALPAHAAVFWDKPALLKSFFATSERVTFKRVVLTPGQIDAVRKRLGQTPAPQLTVYYGMTKGRIDGMALIDNELGQHEPITFGVLISPEGVLSRLEVMVYREAYGDDVCENRFRKQFQGKTARDPVKHGQDIVAIAGATISSKSLATGAKRALVLLDELVIRPGIGKVLQADRTTAGPVPAQASTK